MPQTQSLTDQQLATSLQGLSRLALIMSSAALAALDTAAPYPRLHTRAVLDYALDVASSGARSIIDLCRQLRNELCDTPPQQAPVNLEAPPAPEQDYAVSTTDVPLTTDPDLLRLSMLPVIGEETVLLIPAADGIWELQVQSTAGTRIRAAGLSLAAALQAAALQNHGLQRVLPDGGHD